MPSLVAAADANLSDAPLYEELAYKVYVGPVTNVLAVLLSNDARRTDQIHPNAEGYRQQAEGLYDRVRALG